MKRKVYHVVAYHLCTMEFTRKDILGWWQNWASLAQEHPGSRISVFFSSNVSSSFETPLALVLEDDVLDLRLVLKNALARILRLFHLKRNRYTTNAMKRLRDHLG